MAVLIVLAAVRLTPICLCQAITGITQPPPRTPTTTANNRCSAIQLVQHLREFARAWPHRFIFAECDEKIGAANCKPYDV